MTDHSPEAHEPDQTPTDDTLRGGLRARRAAATNRLYLDRRVPRLDPPVVVRFRPLTSTEVEDAGRKIEKGKPGSRTAAIQNANALAKACIGIWEDDPDGERDEDGNLPKRSPILGDTRDWSEVRFDQELAADLGVPKLKDAASVVLELYLTEGDVISEAGALTEWSGFARRDGDEDWSGNS